jgi:hypothetical protein
MPISLEQLLIMFHAYVQQFDREEAKSVFVNGQKNSVTTFIRHVLDQNQYSVPRKKRLTSSSTPMKPLFYFICKVTMSSYQKE